MPRSNSKNYLGNPKLKAPGINQALTVKQLEEYNKCFNDPIYFIKNYVKIVQVDKGEVPFILRPYQEEMVNILLNNRFNIFKMPRQVGKNFSLDTPIFTPLGFKRYGDIKAGDYVFGSDAKPTLVIEEHPTYNDLETYEIKFDTDETLTCGADHLWTVHNSDWGKNGKTISTKELFEILPKKQKNGSGIRIPLAPSVEFNKQEKELPIDPYVLGFWLGDGTSTNGEFAVAKVDSEIICSLINQAGFITEDYRAAWISAGIKSETAGHHTIQGLKNQLKEHNFLSNKHIPEIYLTATKEQRLELLRGLMDSDGSCTNHNGVCEFYQKKKELIDSVRILISSLGIKNSINEKIIEGQIYYTIRFSTLEKVFKLPRKLERQIKTKGQRTIINTYIQSITPVKSVPMKCISVAAKDGLFLIGNTFIPTHNSITTCAFLLWNILFKESQNIAIIGNKAATAQKLLEDLKQAYMLLPFWIQQGVTKWNERKIELENGCKVMSSATTGDSIRGNTFNIIFLDEFAFVAENVADSFFKSVYPTITSGATTQVIIVSTPHGMNRFHKMWIEANHPRDSKDPKIVWNGYVPFSVHWSMVPKPDGSGLRDEEWKKNIIANTNSEDFRQEFESSFGDTIIELMDENGLVITENIQELYELFTKGI